MCKHFLHKKMCKNVPQCHNTLETEQIQALLLWHSAATACHECHIIRRTNISNAQLSWLKVNMKILTRGRNFTRGKRINGNNVECVALKLPEANEREQDLQTDYAAEPL